MLPALQFRGSIVRCFSSLHLFALDDLARPFDASLAEDLPEAEYKFLHHKTVSIIGAPMRYGQPHEGTTTGPAQLRDAGLCDSASKLGWRVFDKGDISMDGSSLAASCKAKGVALTPVEAAHHCALVGDANASLFNRVKAAAEEGGFVLNLVLFMEHTQTRSIMLVMA